ncbi:MAG: hypothetical protein ISR78_04325 [Spirochaetia bacterium]|nr:hypothetical protein [Spirochaetia bacterium]
MKRIIVNSLSVLLISLFLGSCVSLSPSTSSTQVSQNATPSIYKIAMINFDLIDNGGSTSVNLINASPDTATVVDIVPGTALLSGEKTLSEVINDGTLVNGTTYDEYVMEPLYIEMELEAAFHFHSTCTESGYSLEFTTDGDENDYLFRLYFNPVDNLWKRDILVFLNDTDIQAPAVPAYPTGWYWMRRVIEPGGSANFLILAQEYGVDYTDPAYTLPTHPGIVGAMNPGPVSIIDLFDNNAFWGDPANYDDYAADTVEISSITDYGGLNADWDAFTFSTSDTVTVTADVTDTINFWYESDPAKLDFTAASNPDVIDFGPDYDSPAVSGDEEKLGDGGFHPFMPMFTTATAP